MSCADPRGLLMSGTLRVVNCCPLVRHGVFYSIWRRAGPSHPIRLRPSPLTLRLLSASSRFLCTLPLRPLLSLTGGLASLLQFRTPCSQGCPGQGSALQTLRPASCRRAASVRLGRRELSPGRAHEPPAGMWNCSQAARAPGC